MSQVKLAEIAGLSYHAVSKIENGQRAASIEALWAWAEHFEVSIDYLVGLSDHKERR